MVAADSPQAMHVRDDKFVTSCAARTGSTMLQHMLRSHPDILCHGEVIQPRGVGPLVGTYWARRKGEPGLDDRLWSYLQNDPQTFLYDVIFDRQDRRVVGFKFKTDEAFDERWPHARRAQEAVSRDTDIKIIRLRRRDLLAQYISHQVVLRQTHVTEIRSEDQRPDAEAFSAEPERVVAYFDDVIRRERLADEDYRSHRQIEVWYEDIVDDRTRESERLLRFLGLPTAELISTTKKVLADTRSLLENQEEVLRELERAGYVDGSYPA